MNVIINMSVAEVELTKQELQILNILIGKIQDSYCRCSCDDDTVSYHAIDEPSDYTPPRYEVFITNGGEEKYNLIVSSSSYENAVLKWYQQNGLDGELRYRKESEEWYYNGLPIHLERIDE